MNSPISSDPTAPLEPVFGTEPAHCATHGEYQVRLVDFGFGDKPLRLGCPQCIAITRAAEDARHAEQKAWKERDKIARRFASSGIPDRFMSRTLSNYNATTPGQKRALEIAKLYAASKEPGKSLVLCGKPGTGKTHLACGIGQEMMETSWTVLFRTVLSAIRHIKDTYRKDSQRSEAQALSDFTRAGLLILDEVGVQTGSEHEKMLLFEIINERYQQNYSTIIISNLDREELGAYLGERIMDRFRESGAVVAFDWPSYRGTRAS